ncbi:NAD-dependent epimerase/dehydratase family protein [Mycobacterium persicum]|uniref:Dehydrogenase n=1 Tax=Mycobacterium persicum TaxID=1487726 RepID=A0A1X0L4S0_9MYCO|nr:NAD-dependent epimerase/dehydratase family protein [Mycobacterium persicum]KZS83116.1 dehydrogenase [Mycobacterium persicum]ORB57845.1 dehydrogenase [Mycobacterium persicum]ORB88484.1 dehydrogenase [Mycobacterium persicum]ORB93793.1 dehydrogenase [Mycobacterium persicum]ORC00529.1 dehydrogenase [Mycobacterium persicum]
MQIAVTGGTGYLGAHIVRGLLTAGHDVRLLAELGWNNPQLLQRLSKLGTITVLAGDVRDSDTVTRLLDGCDAVLHAAGVVGTDNRRAKLMWQVNAYATEAVLRQAHDRGLDPIVSINSYSALFPPPGPVIGPDTPTAAGRSAYAKTKGYADRVARRLQDEGAPIVLTYPSSVVGPAFTTAPGITEQGWAPILRTGVAPRLRNAGMMMVDVRDIAEVHVAAMRPGQGPKRYVCGGVMLSFEEMIAAFEAGSGRHIRRIPLSGRAFRTMGRIADVVGGLLPLGAGFSFEAAQLLTAAIPTDDSRTLAELGVTWHSPREAIIATFAHRTEEER